MLGGTAGGAAGTDAVPGGDRDQGVHQPGRPRPRAGPAPAAGRGRRGIPGLPPSGVRDRAVPRARAGRRDGPAAVPGTGTALRSAGGRGRKHLRLPRARRGAALATSASRCWRGCGPGLPRCSPSPSTHRSRDGRDTAWASRGTRPGRAGRRGAARGVAGRPRSARSSASPWLPRYSAGCCSPCSSGAPAHARLLWTTIALAALAASLALPLAVATTSSAVAGLIVMHVTVGAVADPRHGTHGPDAMTAHQKAGTALQS